jgi:hypothetical protein
MNAISCLQLRDVRIFLHTWKITEAELQQSYVVINVTVTQIWKKILYFTSYYKIHVSIAVVIMHKSATYNYYDLRPDSYNKGAKEAAIVRQRLCKHSVIPETLLRNIRTQQWRNSLKRSFLCGPRRGYKKSKFCVASSCLQKKSSPQHWQSSKAHTNSRYAYGVQNSVRIWLYNKIMQATSISHTKSW